MAFTESASASNKDAESIAGADAYVIIRDGNEVVGSLRIEGSQKNWTDKGDT
jgi:hypothetical protein